MKHSKIKLIFLFSGIITFGMAMGYWIFVRYSPQTSCDKQLELSVNNFANLTQADTIDLAKLVPFAWDTVYVFESYTSAIELSRDLKHVDWSRIMSREATVPEDVNRFIFIKDAKAISSWDASKKLIKDVQFSKYFLDEKGNYKTSYEDINGNYHRYEFNYFSRANAKFVLVRPGIGSGFLFCPLSYFINNRKIWPVPLKTDHLLYLHPINGCGFPDCLANKKIYP